MGIVARFIERFLRYLESSTEAGMEEEGEVRGVIRWFWRLFVGGSGSRG